MTVYTAKHGDTFTKIASQHRVKHWQDLFFAKENAALRQKIQRPERLQPGHQVIIPKVVDPAIRDKERQRLIGITRMLNSEKQKIEAEFEKLRKENDQAARKLKTFASRIDAVAAVATVLVSLGTMSAQAAKTMSLSGEALKKANKEFLEEFLKSRAEGARDLALQVADAAIEEPDSLALMLTKSVAVAFGSVTAPSFWAAGWEDIKNGRWNPTGWTPEALRERTDKELLKHKMGALTNIDSMIAKYNQAVANLR